MDGGAWLAAVHWVTKQSDMTQQVNNYLFTIIMSITLTNAVCDKGKQSPVCICRRSYTPSFQEVIPIAGEVIGSSVSHKKENK